MALPVEVKPFPLDSSELATIGYLYDNIKSCDIVFLSPLLKKKQEKFGIELVFSINSGVKAKIEKVALDGVNVTSQTQIKQRKERLFWGKEEIKIKYQTQIELFPGLHVFLIKMKEGESSRLYVYPYVVEPAGLAKRKQLDKRLPREVTEVFYKLMEVQSKARNMQAYYEGTFKDFTNPQDRVVAKIRVEGRLRVGGGIKNRQFLITLSKEPVCSVIDQNGYERVNRDPFWREKVMPGIKKIGLNEIDGRNIMFFMDYEGLANGYDWEIAAESEDEIYLRGRSVMWDSRMPQQWILWVDKKSWVPKYVESFLEQDNIISSAILKYDYIGKEIVPIRQEVSILVGPDAFKRYETQLSNILVNRKELEIPKKYN